jgi:hypothetical protein
MGDGEEKGRYFLYSLSPLFFLLFIFFYLEELRETFFSFFLFGFFSSFHLFFREGKRGLIFWRGRRVKRSTSEKSREDWTRESIWSPMIVPRR